MCKELQVPRKAELRFLDVDGCDGSFVTGWHCGLEINKTFDLKQMEDVEQLKTIRAFISAALSNAGGALEA